MTKRPSPHGPLSRDVTSAIFSLFSLSILRQSPSSRFCWFPSMPEISHPVEALHRALLHDRRNIGSFLSISRVVSFLAFLLFVFLPWALSSFPADPLFLNFPPCPGRFVTWVPVLSYEPPLDILNACAPPLTHAPTPRTSYFHLHRRNFLVCVR